MNELGPLLIAFRLTFGAAAPVSAPPPPPPLSTPVVPSPPPPPSPADEWFAEDKLRHFFMSFATTQLAFGAARAAGIERTDARALGIAAGGAAGLWKEFRDRRLGLPFSTRDLVWDAAGVAAAAVVVTRTKAE